MHSIIYFNKLQHHCLIQHQVVNKDSKQLLPTDINETVHVIARPVDLTTNNNESHYNSCT